MRILLILLFFIFLQADTTELYKVRLKLININDKFVELINSFENNSKLKKTIDLMEMQANYSLASLLYTYKNQTTVQKYFNYLKNKNKYLKLVMNKNQLNSIDNNVSNMQIIENIKSEINKIKYNKINNMSSIKQFYNVIIEVMNTEIFLIKTYHLSPNFVIAQKNKEKARILKTLKVLKSTIEKNYNKNIKPYDHFSFKSF